MSIARKMAKLFTCLCGSSQIGHSIVLYTKVTLNIFRLPRQQQSKKLVIAFVQTKTFLINYFLLILAVDIIVYRFYPQHIKICFIHATSIAVTTITT